MNLQHFTLLDCPDTLIKNKHDYKAVLNSVFSNNRNLISIQCNGYQLNSQLIHCIANNCVNVETLHVCCGNEMTENDVIYLAHKCRKLVDFSQFSCIKMFKFSEAAVEALRNKCHNLLKLSVFKIK